jgi:hypothetical protein
MEVFLKLPSGKLGRLADLQRQEELKRRLADPPTPLFKEVRDLVLRKCKLHKQRQMRGIFRSSPSANSSAL